MTEWKERAHRVNGSDCGLTGGDHQGSDDGICWNRSTVSVVITAPPDYRVTCKVELFLKNFVITAFSEMISGKAYTGPKAHLLCIDGYTVSIITYWPIFSCT